MRIAIITATPASVAEGSGTHVAAQALSAGLAAAGHTVQLVQPGPSDRPMTTLSRLAFNRALAEPTDADVIVGFDMDGYRLAGHSRVPFVAYVHGIIADEMRFDPWLVRARRWIEARAERHAVRHAALVLATSRYSRQRLIELYGADASRIAIVPPPVDVTGWQREVSQAAARPRRRPTVLAVAHWYRRKNLPALIRVAAGVRQRTPDVEFRIAGMGPEQPNGVRAVRARHLGRSVTFLGHVSRATLAAEYAGCDVFCLPSRQEGFGLVYVEAMAAGKPVVALAAARAPAELISHGQNGFLAADDVDDLAENVQLLLRDEALRERMGAANRVAATRWDSGRSVERFLDAIGRLSSPHEDRAGPTVRFG